MIDSLTISLNNFLWDALRTFVLLFIFNYTTIVLMNIGEQSKISKLSMTTAVITLALDALMQLLLSAVFIACALRIGIFIFF